MLKLSLFCPYNKPCILNCQGTRVEGWRKPTITKKSLHRFLYGSDTTLHQYTVCMYCLLRLSMFRIFRHGSISQILTCEMCKTHLLTFYHLHTFINLTFPAVLTVCNLFLFGDAQAPTMQGQLYNGVPCLEPFACTTCRRYKRNCSQYSEKLSQ